jgi:hypothetical protein
MHPFIPSGLTALLLAGCSTDIGTVPHEAAFTEAVLEPPFEHANAVWAGVALTDANGDGRLDLIFSNGTNHRDGLYINQGDGRFVDQAAAAGLPAEPQHGGVVSGDIDNDGDEDLVFTVECSNGTLTESGTGLADGGFQIFRNDGKAHYTLEELDPSLKEEIQVCPVSVELFDIDNDGDLDLMTANGLDLDQVFPWIFQKDVVEAADYVLLNDGEGRFSEALLVESPLKDGPNPLNHFVTFTSLMMDVDQDGSFERIAGSGGTPIGVWNNQDGALSIRQEGSTVGEGLWMGLAPGDYTGDGQLEIYGTNMGLSPLIAGYDNLLDYAERLFGHESANTDDLTTDIFHGLIRVSQTGTLEILENWPVFADGPLAGDFFDGYIDPESSEPRYPDWIQPEGFQRYPWGWGAVALDYDADGWVDVAFNGNNCSAPMDIIWEEERGAGPGALLRNLEGKAFQDVTWASGVANIDSKGRFVDGRGIATGDLNGDGYADLVYANRTYNPLQSDPLAQEVGVPHVWLSKPRQGNWLRVKLHSSTGNRQGLGGMVWVNDGTKETVHGLGLGGGTNSSSERALTLGLGQSETVDLRVRFRSGKEVILKGISANQEITVTED